MNRTLLAFDVLLATTEELLELATSNRDHFDRARASELLRTRIDLTIETQNQQLMQAMDKRSHTQLRLQQTVEGLSVAAISYYLVGLCKYLAESAKSLGLLADSQLATGLAVPLCIGLVWFSLRRLKRRLKLGEG